MDSLNYVFADKRIQNNLYKQVLKWYNKKPLEIGNCNGVGDYRFVRCLNGYCDCLLVKIRSMRCWIKDKIFIFGENRIII